jgi:cytochrome c oxidase assembly protein subunit 15
LVNTTLPQRNGYFWLAAFATVLAFCVILLGAYTRLKDAGLGCPDWPGCYGQITVPHTTSEIQQAAKLFPGEKVEAAKAWPEMVHRYFAGTLGLIIFILAIWSIVRKLKYRDQPLWIPLILAAFVIFQAALGMWTVTWKLLPLVVMGHLLGGFTVAALLWWLTLKTGGFLQSAKISFQQLRPWAWIALIIVALQIFLGGWTSANYASLACTHFPFCNGSLFPPMAFKEAFNFASPIGTNYQGGVLDMAARVTIHMMHRYGALVTFLFVGALSVYLIVSRSEAGLRPIGWIILLLLLLQILLGILNVVLMLPLLVAVAHNGVAALLLLSLVTLLYKLYAVEKKS